ncbi:MAG: ATP-dependent Clp protease proteolytic subunit [Vicinamibacterales bacterium]
MSDLNERLIAELVEALKAALKREQTERLRDVYLIGDIEKDTARVVIERLRELASENTKPITVYINTAGGNVTDGLAIHDAVAQVVAQGIEVSVVVQGMAYSMGSVVLQAASPGCRVSFPHSWIMIHEPAKWAGWQSTTAAAQHLDRLKQMQSQIYRILSARSGKPLKQIIRDTKRMDFYLDATRALEYGLVDRVLGVTHASTPVLSDVSRDPNSEAAAAIETRSSPDEVHETSRPSGTITEEGTSS